MRLRRRGPGAVGEGRAAPGVSETTPSPDGDGESSPYPALEAAIARGNTISRELVALVANREPLVVELRQVTARANALKAEGKKREAQRLLGKEGLPLRNAVVALGARIDSLTVESNRLMAVLSVADQYLPPESDDPSDKDDDPPTL